MEVYLIIHSLNFDLNSVFIFSDKLAPNGTLAASGLLQQKENQPKRVKLEKEIALLQRKEDEVSFLK